MTLVEHLVELRQRHRSSARSRSWSCAVIMFILFDRRSCTSSRARTRTSRRPQRRARQATGCKLIVTGPLEPFLVRLKIAGYGGIALAIPDRDVADLALRRARRCTRTNAGTRSRSSLAVVVLFAAGLRGGVVHRRARRSSSCSSDRSAARSSRSSTADKYLTLVMLMFIAFGVAFEFPRAARVLVARRRGQHPPAPARPAVGDPSGSSIFAAVITPSQDPFSLLFMAVPMYIFYEVVDPDRAGDEAMSPSSSTRRAGAPSPEPARARARRSVGAVAVVARHRAARLAAAARHRRRRRAPAA